MITVADNRRLRRYEVYVDEALAGFVAYTRGRRSIIFSHTEIGDGFAKRGSRANSSK